MIDPLKDPFLPYIKYVRDVGIRNVIVVWRINEVDIKRLVRNA
jgi:hypothetical protein